MAIKLPMTSAHVSLSVFVLLSFQLLNQPLASFIKEKSPPVCSGMLLMISESPGSTAASAQTL